MTSAPHSAALQARRQLEGMLSQDPNAELFVEVTSDSRYEVSNMGRVRHRQKGTFLKFTFLEDSYPRVHLHQQHIYVHTLVAQAFVPRDSNPSRIVVDHIDGDKNNYRWDNLRWLTPSENTMAHYALSEKSLKLIMMTVDGTEVGSFISTTHCIKSFPELSLSAHGISEVCLGHQKLHRGYVFRYLDGGRTRHITRELFTDECFRNIGNFEGKDLSKYEISSHGLLRNTRGMYLVPVIDAGYVAYMLRCEKVRVEVRAHRLVAHAFCAGRTADKNIVHHKDEDRQNNHYSNLQWCSHRENSEFSRAKPVEQMTLDGKVVAVHRSMTVAAAVVNCNISAICNCVTESRRRKTAKGFRWRLVQTSG